MPQAPQTLLVVSGSNCLTFFLASQYYPSMSNTTRRLRIQEDISILVNSSKESNDKAFLSIAQLREIVDQTLCHLLLWQNKLRSTWLNRILEYTLYNMYTLVYILWGTFSSTLIFSDVIHHTLGLLCTRDFDSQLVCTWRPPRLTGSTFDMINVGASQSQLTFQLLPRAMSVILRDSQTQIWFQILPHWKLTSGMWCSIMTEEQEEIVTLFS